MHPVDEQLKHITSRFWAEDPTGERTARVIRKTFDQIYDGRHTGRYRVDQLSKTEKTHIGSLIEINLRREFTTLFQDGERLDFKVDGIEIDCKFSIYHGKWMIPREAVGELLLVCTANDEESEWGIGVVRATEDKLNNGKNQDSKRTFKAASVADVEWIFFGASLPENVLLHTDQASVDRILAPGSGQKRINLLLQAVTNRLIPRGTIATVAQQDDYMKRLRGYGGARTALAPLGYLIIVGTYSAHRDIARDLGAVVPGPGDTVSLRVVPATADDTDTVMLDGSLWRLASSTEVITVAAPKLPETKKSAQA